jgi:cyclopropane-fatty-acyl-phospholipid synthase
MQGDQGQRRRVLRGRGTMWRLLLNPKLSLGEAYVDGGLVPLGCSIHDVLAVALANLRSNPKSPLVTWLRRAAARIWRPVDQFNAAGRARRNVAHHYDLNGQLYSLFLDRDLQYSCAYFPKGTETLEEAQTAKKRHIAAKLCLDRPGLSVLDIGCGWGGMALTLARDYGAEVTGITLSMEQLGAAKARTEAEGLADRVSFQLLDYRAADRRFDRIVSVGMFEHVGVFHYRAFFDTVSRCLKPDGVALLHSIGQWDGPGINNPWISKYIFPGAYCPALSEVMPAIERSGLLTTDIEVLRLHYAETLRHWRRRFAASRDTIASLYDERFCRMFEFYLSSCELGFRIWTTAEGQPPNCLFG